jgi:hypothetical protein
MLKKVIKKLTKPKEPKTTPPEPKLLTAEGWRRLMMKKYRKS